MKRCGPQIKLISILVLFLLLREIAQAQSIKILFDATKAETAGNADWIIDADAYNMDWNPGAQLSGNESNAQQTPTPQQNTITGATPENFWKGALSNWGIDCVKQGYEVETLPYYGSITYGDTNNLQDLMNYNVYIVCEPNILFTSSEKIAILNFVQNGGGLFMVSDHDQSDRNNDGWDSPAIWNDLMTANPFGITFNLHDFSETTFSVTTDISDSIANGPFGMVTEAQWSSGTDMTIDAAANSSVKGIVFRDGFVNDDAQVMVASAHYGNGKVASIGDSSPCDDGTGDNNDNLYNGYTLDANGNHETLLMNATIWLASPADLTTTIPFQKADEWPLTIFSNGKNLFIESSVQTLFNVKIFDVLGKCIYQQNNFSVNGSASLNLDALSNGMYMISVERNDHAVALKKIFL